MENAPDQYLKKVGKFTNIFLKMGLYIEDI